MKYSQLKNLKDYTHKVITNSNQMLLYSTTLQYGLEIEFFKRIDPENFRNMYVRSIRTMATRDKVSRLYFNTLGGGFQDNNEIWIDRKKLRLFHCGEHLFYDKIKKEKIIEHSYGFLNQNEGEIIHENDNVRFGSRRGGFLSGSTFIDFTGSMFNARLDEED